MIIQQYNGTVLSSKDIYDFFPPSRIYSTVYGLHCIIKSVLTSLQGTEGGFEGFSYSEKKICH